MGLPKLYVSVVMGNNIINSSNPRANREIPLQDLRTAPGINYVHISASLCYCSWYMCMRDIMSVVHEKLMWGCTQIFPYSLLFVTLHYITKGEFDLKTLNMFHQ